MAGKLRLLVWIGIIVLFVPFFGITDWMRTVLTIIIGVVIIYLSFTLKFAYKKLKFESRPQSEPDTTPIIHGTQ